MEHRRRGADFSSLIQSFNSEATDSESAPESLDPIKHSRTQTNRITVINNVTYDGNVKIIPKNSYEDDTSATGSFKSTILAGQAADRESPRTSESSYRTAGSSGAAGGVRSTDVSWDSCQLRRPPADLNRAITAQFSPRPELDLSRTSVEPGSSEEMNRNIDFCSDKSSEHSRDTNHNIKDEETPFEPKPYKIDEESQTPLRNPRVSTPRPAKMERKDAWSLLSSLDNVLDPSGDKTQKTKRQILRRLSHEFSHSPLTFTERLVTIIDESENGPFTDEPSGVELSRMTKEFRKMCKYIQDESMPEMAPSLCANSILETTKNHENEKKTNYEIPSTILESPTDSQTDEFSTPPLRHNVSVRKIYRKTPLNIFKKTHRDNAVVGSPGSPNSTKEFELLEKLCQSPGKNSKILPKIDPKPLRRSLSSGDVDEASRENLLRSLEDDDPTNCETFDSHQAYGPKKPEVKPPSFYFRNQNYVAKNVNDVAASSTLDMETNDDELSNSLLMEKELQRQRCFETALMMQKIENETKQTNEEYPKALKRHGIDPEKALIETISSCMIYENCVSGIRKNKRLNGKEGSSVDSGIDLRSFGRTFQSSKKSCDETTSRNSNKNNCEATLKKEKSEIKSTIRSNVGGSTTGTIKKINLQPETTKKINLHSETTMNVKKQNTVLLRRKSPIYLRSSGKTVGQTKSPVRKRSSPLDKTRTKTSGISEKILSTRNQDKALIPELIVTTSTPGKPKDRTNSQLTCRNDRSPSPRKNTPKSVSPRSKTSGCNYSRSLAQGSSWNSQLRSQLRSQRATSPGKRCLTPSFGPSPSSKNFNKERVPKMTNLQAENQENNPSSASAKAQASPRYKLFVTPGRNATSTRKRKTKTYFPTMDADINAERPELVMKSLHAPGLFRLGYKGVISPVNMYIHGTDVNLVHNNHERKDEMMLTPKKISAAEEKLRFALGSKATKNRDSPRRGYKNLTDEEDSETDENDKKMRDLGFALPEARYDQPARVQTVNERPETIRGGRTRELLSSVKNRVVIRHEGKRQVPESCSDSATDISLHVLKSAEKTNFMSHRKF